MADNTVEYKIKLKGEGADSVDKLKHLVEGLGGSIEQAKNSSEGLKTSLLNFNQAVGAIQNVAAAFSQVSSAVSGMTQFYAAQVEAETKLQTVMRNTMNASDGRLKAAGEPYRVHAECGVYCLPSGLPGPMRGEPS